MGSDANPEPSMEEILASIKRVIADDNRQAGGGPRSARPRRSQPEAVPEAEDEADEDDVLELDDALRADEGLISPHSAAASRHSLAQLASLRQQRPALDPDDPIDQGPLEAVVRDMLRPMLKQWLDERLPDMVEELVAREIARITGKKF